MKITLTLLFYLMTALSDCNQNYDRTVFITAVVVIAKNSSVEIIYGKEADKYYKIVYDKKKAGIDKDFIFQVKEQYELSIFRFDTIRPEEWLHESAWYYECLVIENSKICPDDTIKGLYILNSMKKKE